MAEMKLQILNSYLASVTGGWIPYTDQKSSLNQILQMYIWILFATIPTFANIFFNTPLIAGTDEYSFLFTVASLIYFKG